MNNYKLHVNKISFYAFLIFLAISRNAITIQNPTDGWIVAIKAFPNFKGFVSSNVGLISIYKMLSINSSLIFIIFNGVVFVLFFLLVIWKLSCMNSSIRYLAGIIFVTSPLITHLMTALGTPDVFLYIGWIGLMLANNKKPCLVFALLVTLMHPYQSIIGSFCLFLYGIGSGEQKIRLKARYVFISSALVLVFINLWASLSQAQETREKLFHDYFISSLINFLTLLPNSFFALMGPIWVLFVIIFFKIKYKFHKISMLFGVILIPVLFTAVTADGTRVFIGITLPIMFEVVRKFLGSLQPFEDNKNTILIISLFFIFYPVTYQITDFMLIPWQGLYSNLNSLFMIKP